MRRALRSARRTRSPDPTRAATLANAVLTHEQVRQRLADSPGSLVLGYVSLPHEPPTEDLRVRLLERGATVALPIAHPDGSMTWIEDPGSDARAWGVPRQPQAPPPEASARAIDLGHATSGTAVAIVIVPALAATADGRRLGQGGGYYDRLLAELAPADAGGPLRVVVVGPEELLADLPTDAHDQRVDVVITG